jgi:nicotinamide-nucleotide amidase
VFDAETLALAAIVLAACRAKGWRLATAESCTGGLVVAALTSVAGSSDVVDRGFVTYSNKAKMELLGVPEATLAAQGAVSAETALAMAQGAVARAGVDLAVSITGFSALAAAAPRSRSDWSISASPLEAPAAPSGTSSRRPRWDTS